MGRTDRDVDGDGYADAFIGAREADPNGDNSGAVYLVKGVAAANFGLDDSVGGTAAEDNLGTSVAYAGDVNADGFGDLAVGVTGVGAFVGSVYVYFGSPVALHGPVSVLDGIEDAAFFGSSVSTAGDVNNDGYADILVGADQGDPDVLRIDAGRAYLYFGGPGAVFDDTPDAVLDGEASDDRFGRSVASAGDVNGDGFADLIVGAPQNGAGGFQAGRAYLFLGGPGTFDVGPDGTLTGAAPEDWFGHAVSSAGDANGDGFSDVVVGAMFSDLGGMTSGSVGVYFGGPLTTPVDETPEGSLVGVGGELLGFSVASAGDVNGDGFGDIIAGAPQSSTGGSFAGAAYVLLGGPGTSFDVSADGTLVGAASGEFFGADVAGTGDLDGDRFDDLVVGATPLSGTSTGAAFVYLGDAGSTFEATSDRSLLGPSAGSRFGIAVGSR